MIVEVDQSIKVEQTHRATVLAFSNGIQRTLLIPARVKQKAIKRLRTKGKYEKRLYLWLFTLALYHLVKNHLSQITVIIVDVEYTGKEEDIKALLLQLLSRHGARPSVGFRQISRKSAAHKAAIAVVRGNAKPNRTLTTGEFLEPLMERK